MLISKSRSFLLPVVLLTIGSGVACSESIDPNAGSGGALASGGAAAGGAASGGAAAGGAASGGAASGGAASGGAASGGAASGGSNSGGSESGGSDSGGSNSGGSESGGGPGAGGGSSVTFDEVADILVARCATAGCHVAPGAPTKPNFSTPEAINTAFNDIPPISQCGNNPLVTANEPEQSALVLLINGACTAGGPGSPGQMPPSPNPGKIPDEDIQTIEDWVSGGAPRPE